MKKETSITFRLGMGDKVNVIDHAPFGAYHNVSIFGTSNNEQWAFVFDAKCPNHIEAVRQLAIAFGIIEKTKDA